MRTGPCGGWLLLLLACGSEKTTTPPLVDGGGTVDVGLKLDSPAPSPDGTDGAGQGGASGGSSPGAGDGSAGAGGRDPNLLAVRIVHAATRFANEPLDFCVQMGNGEPAGPYLHNAGVVAGVPFGSVSAPRNVPRGANLVMRVVRGAGGDCTGPLGYPALSGLGTYDDVDVVLSLQESGVISMGLQSFRPPTADKDTIAFYDLLNDVGGGAKS